jgi:hypothetical protein
MITRHWCVFGRWGGLAYPKPFLSLRIRRRQRHHAAHMAETIAGLAAAIRSRPLSAHFATLLPDFFRVHFDNPAHAVEALEMLASQPEGALSGIEVASNRLEVEVRVTPFEKSVAVRTLREALGVPAVATLAIGDGRSDLKVMSEEVSGAVGCPANAKAVVVAAVMKRGGHVSRQNALAGVLDVIEAYAAGTPDSTPPPRWVPPSGEIGLVSYPARSAHGMGQMGIELGLIVSALVITFVVLASFNIIPYGSDLLWPVRKLVEWFARLT